MLVPALKEIQKKYNINAVNIVRKATVFIALTKLTLFCHISVQFVRRHYYLQLNMLTLTVNHYTSVISKPFQSAFDNPFN
jgi:hypothetical protein